MTRRFKRVSIRNYRGVRELDVDLGEKGVVFCGTNGVGKSSAVYAMKTALSGGDVKPDAITSGEERCEIVCFTEHETIRRLITEKSQNVTITTNDGAKMNKPQERLDRMAGELLDPLAVFEAKGADLRAVICKALPATATVAQLREFAPDLPDTFDCSGHALDACKRAHKVYYDRRTAANKLRDASKDEAERAKADSDRLTASLPANVESIQTVVTALEAASRKVGRLENAVAAAADQARKAEGGRRKVETLRAEGAAKADQANKTNPGPATALVEGLKAERASVALAVGEVERLKAALSEAEKFLAARRANERKAADLLAFHEAQAATADRLRSEAQRKAQEADTLEATITEQAIAPPSEEEIEAARAEERRLQQAKRDAETAEHAAKVKVQADRLAADAAKKRADAETLDRIVKRLENEAPKALLAEHAIEGIDLCRDDGVWLDGVKFPNLCGFERLALATQIAKRVNADAKVLIVDGLERVAEDNLDKFIDLATADGWTLVASRVTRGEFYVVSLDKAPVAAKEGAAA